MRWLCVRFVMFFQVLSFSYCSFQSLVIKYFQYFRKKSVTFDESYSPCVFWCYDFSYSFSVLRIVLFVRDHVSPPLLKCLYHSSDDYIYVSYYFQWFNAMFVAELVLFHIEWYTAAIQYHFSTIVSLWILYYVQVSAYLAYNRLSVCHILLMATWRGLIITNIRPLKIHL